jgi:hypothetical protein
LEFSAFWLLLFPLAYKDSPEGLLFAEIVIRRRICPIFPPPACQRRPPGFPFKQENMCKTLWEVQGEGNVPLRSGSTISGGDLAARYCAAIPIGTWDKNTSFISMPNSRVAPRRVLWSWKLYYTDKLGRIRKMSRKLFRSVVYLIIGLALLFAAGSLDSARAHAAAVSVGPTDGSADAMTENVPPMDANDLGAELYPCPRPVPARVSHTTISYPPLAPHEFLNRHRRVYRTEHVGATPTRTSVHWR